MDEIDRALIEALLERPQTVHQLSKRIYKTEDQYKLRGHNSTLTYRLGRLAQEGLVRKGEGRGGKYFVPLKEITHGRAKLVVSAKGGLIEIDMGRVLYTQADGRRQVVFLE